MGRVCVSVFVVKTQGRQKIKSVVKIYPKVPKPNVAAKILDYRNVRFHMLKIGGSLGSIGSKNKK